MSTMIMRMNVGEAQRYFEGRSIRRILFNTQDQAWNRIDNPLRIDIGFSKMIFSGNPDAIYLKDGSNIIAFERVKYIDIDEGTSPLGTVLEVTCGGQKKTVYTLVVQ